METSLKVKGMHCSGCEGLIKDVVSDITGAKAISADAKTGTVRVSHDTPATLEKIKAAIRENGYQV